MVKYCTYQPGLKYVIEMRAADKKTAPLHKRWWQIERKMERFDQYHMVDQQAELIEKIVKINTQALRNISDYDAAFE